MALTDIHVPSVMDTSSHNLFEEFFIPVLSRSIRYDRGVGFFSAGWLQMAASGMVVFARNSGRARWVTSPILSEADWQALQLGTVARVNEVLQRSLDAGLDNLEEALTEDTLSALAWLVADGILDFRLALPRNKLEKGMFHDKFGVFADAEGNLLSFAGSYNDSIQGTRNYEAIKVFRSWNPAFQELVTADKQRFERLWNNFDPNVQVFTLPDAARARIVHLRSTDRPYPEPDWTRLKALQASEASIEVASSGIRVSPDITLRDYQVEAIEKWFENNCLGLMEMATGTGKTITALAAAARLYEQQNRLALIVACPYQHLVDQWYEEARRFGFVPYRAYSSRTSWLDELNQGVLHFAHEDIPSLCIITTHATFASEHFQGTIARLSGPRLLVADEVHHMGSGQRRNFLPGDIDFRLALSATPDRWYDETGTNALFEYFGNTVFSLSLGEAIELGCLTPYYYYPILVELTEEELDRYRELSAKIGKLMAMKQGVLSEDDGLTRLLTQRARILNTASNKLPAVAEKIDQTAEIQHTLVYTAPGQIDDVVRLLGWEKRLRVHRFTAREDIATRSQLLDSFARGDLQALVAMHCLDEGVDVPSTRTAFILASSSNPRQFIQRRGRILRKAPDKDRAVIYDLITVPPSSGLDEAGLAAERAILRRELRRFAEFADSARNTQAAYQVIWEIATEFKVLDF